MSSLETVNVLLGAGANVNASAAPNEGVTALQAAAINGQMEIFLILLKAGANVNAPGAMEDGRTALEGAAEHGRLDMLQLLLNAGATHDEPSCEKAEKLAAGNGHYVVAKLLKGLY